MDEYKYFNWWVLVLRIVVGFDFLKLMKDYIYLDRRLLGLLVCNDFIVVFEGDMSDYIYFGRRVFVSIL